MLGALATISRELLLAFGIHFVMAMVVAVVGFLLESKAHLKLGFGWAVQFWEDFKLGMDFKINFHPH